MRSIVTVFGAAKALLERVRLLSFIGYVEGRVAVFAGGVFVVISSLHYAHYYENYAEYGENAGAPIRAAMIVQNMPNTIANTEPINFIPEGPLPGFTLFIRFLLYSFLIALSGLSRIALMAG